MSDRDVADKLRKARELVARGWTQGAFARDRLGFVRWYDEPDATCWCSLGAIRKVEKQRGAAGVEPVLPWQFLSVAIGDEHIQGWNDAPGRTQAEVLAAFDRAIALAEAHDNG